LTHRERGEKSYFSVLCCFVHPKERQGKKEQTRQKQKKNLIFVLVGILLGL
jgi:hypothetical protein